MGAMSKKMTYKSSIQPEPVSAVSRLHMGLALQLHAAL